MTANVMNTQLLRPLSADDLLRPSATGRLAGGAPSVEEANRIGEKIERLRAEGKLQPAPKE